MLSFKQFDACGNISAFVTTRHQPIAGDDYSSFNLGLYSGDNPDRVYQNRQLLCQALEIPFAHLYLSHQIHGTSTLIIDDTFLNSPADEQLKRMDGVDALITDRKGICIGVTTADCVPVLLYDRQKQVAAAIHAGWRGTVAQVVSLCIRTMISQWDISPENIIAAIGPSIGKSCFEVGDEVYEAFKQANFDLAKASERNARTGKFHIDLWEANRQELICSGIPPKQIEVAGICTHTSNNQFYSARTLGIDSGRFVSGIIIR